MIENKTFAILDTETTGLYANKGDKIVEIAIVKIRNGTVFAMENISTLINPGIKIPESSIKIHNITNEMVELAPSFKEAIPLLKTFLEDVDYIFMHNAKFDMSFLQKEYKQNGEEILDHFPPVICSVELSKYLYPEYRSHSLDSIAKRMSLSIKDGEGRHRALGDVIMTGEAVLNFYKDNPLIFIGTLKELKGKY